MLESIDPSQLAQFGKMEFLAKQVVEGFITGMHKSPFHGFSVEFAEHRLYNKGESTRHVDWKLFARSEKLFTKKYEEETNLRCQIVVDISSSMQFKAKNGWTKLEFALLAGASMGELMKRQRDAVGLSLFNTSLAVHTPAKSSGAHHRYLNHEMEKCLVEYNPSNATATNAISILHDLAELCHKRSLIILFTDLLDDPSAMEDFIQAIQHLKHNKHEVIVFHIVDKAQEIDFKFDNRPINLVDMETGERMRILPKEIQTNYKTKISAYFDEVALKCLQYNVDFVAADINESLNEVLMRYLLKRQKLF